MRVALRNNERNFKKSSVILCLKVPCHQPLKKIHIQFILQSICSQMWIFPSFFHLSNIDLLSLSSMLSTSQGPGVKHRDQIPVNLKLTFQGREADHKLKGPMVSSAVQENKPE